MHAVSQWLSVLVLVCLLSAAGPGSAQPVVKDAPLAFSIPAQSLASALDRYGDVTGREAFYDTKLAQSRVSTEVQGVFTPNEALERLLAGTGLLARYMPDNSFVLLTTPLAQPAPSRAASLADQRYYARIQESLRDAFCRNSEARPGRYRFVAVLWIGSSGRVEHSQRLGSVGAPDADQRIDATLRDLRMSEPPPAGFAQPVLIMVVPEDPGITMRCEAANSRFRPAGAAP